MDTATRVQTLDKAVCISHGTYILEKGINPTILLPALCKIVGQTGLFNLVMATGLGGKILNSAYRIDLVSKGW